MEKNSKFETGFLNGSERVKIIGKFMFLVLGIMLFVQSVSAGATVNANWDGTHLIVNVTSPQTVDSASMTFNISTNLTVGTAARTGFMDGETGGHEIEEDNVTHIWYQMDSISSTTGGLSIPITCEYPKGVYVVQLIEVNLKNSSESNITVDTAMPMNFTVNCTVPETCNNGIDDNANGLIDCCDPECYGNAVCIIDLGNVTTGGIKQGFFYDHGSFCIIDGTTICYNVTNISYTFTDMIKSVDVLSKTNFNVFNISSLPVVSGADIHSTLNISVPGGQATGEYIGNRSVLLTFNSPENDTVQLCSNLKLNVQPKPCDGTPHGSCSATIPKYCSNGNLIDNCSACGCPSGQNCNATSGTCTTQCIAVSQIQVSVSYSNGTPIQGAVVSVFVGGVFKENLTTNAQGGSVSSPSIPATGASIEVRVTINGVNYNKSGFLICGDTLELNINVTTCSDGTLYNTSFSQCSLSKPKYCSNGILTDNCSLCGCPSGQTCNATIGTCYLSCSDGTLYGQCSSTRPKYCSNGVLIDNCSACGCPSGQNCTVFSLTNVSATAVNAGSQIIAWNTNAYANSTVMYGTNSSNLNLTASNSTLVASHSITLTGLNTTNTTITYYYKVTSCDCSGNCITSNMSNFTTAKPNNATCTLDSECLSGSCLNGICKDKLALGYTCYRDANCLSNKCFNSLCSAPCTIDENCSDSEFCNFESGVCQHKLSAGALCNRNRMCLNGNCANGYVCFSGSVLSGGGAGGGAGGGILQGVPLDVTTNATSSTYTGDTFTVTVTSNNIPVQGAKVVYGNQTNYTKSDGKVTFKAVEGTHEVKTEAFGYVPKSLPLTIITKPVVLPTLDISISPESPNKDETFTVTVKSNNVPVKDAKVTYGDNTKYTNADGQVQFTAVVGRTLISASKDGYTGAERYLEVKEPVPVVKKLDVSVSPETSTEGTPFTVTVTSEGKPVSGISVTYSGVSKTTDSNGKVSFTSVKGTLSLSAAGEGYDKATLSVTGLEKPAPPPAFDWTIPIVILVLLILALLAYWFLKGRGGVEITKSRKEDIVTVKVRNSGKEDISNALIEDVIPPDAKVDIRSLGAELKSGKIVYSVGTISSGEEKVLEYKIDTAVESLPKARIVWDKGEKVSD